MTHRLAFSLAATLLLIMLAFGAYELSRSHRTPPCHNGWMPTEQARQCCHAIERAVVADRARCVDGGVK